MFGYPINGKTTYQEIRDGLTFDMPLNDDVPDVVTDVMVNAAIVDCFSTVRDMASVFDSSLDVPDDDANDDMASVFDSSLDVPDDDANDDMGESCHAWFLLSWESEENDE